VCINNARAIPDIQGCWNYFSERPGEYQSNQTEGLSGFTDFWTRFKVQADIYYCTTNLVTVVEQYYLRTDTSKPIDPDIDAIIEYELAFDDSGWRIKSGTIVTNLRASCGNEPRVTISPNQ
jgi:hypothetical protein